MSQSNRLAWWLGVLVGAAIFPLRAMGAADPFAAPDLARAEGAFDRGEPRVEARLLVDPDEALGSDTVRLGVLFDLDPGWHLYWRDPGESGLPTELSWSVPGASLEPVAWPAPAVFRESEGTFTTYGYQGRVLLATRAIFGAGAPGERVARVRADLLVCEVECIPASLTLERRLDTAQRSGAVRALFEAAAQRVPRAPGALGIELAANLDANSPDSGALVSGSLAVRSCDGERRCAHLSPADPVFFPDRRGGAEIEVSGVEPVAAGGFRVAFTGRRTSPEAPRLTGVLALTDGSGAPRFVEVDLALPDSTVAANPDALGLAQALALALLGGLVLNLMPCVLPILALKGVAIAELAHRRRSEALAHGAAYLAGVLASMALLAALVVALRSAGTAVGWGFQFQEPLFVAAVASVLVVFAINLFGVFEIGVDTGRLATIGRQAAGSRRSFFDGLLAVVLATPCSAPFLGTAVGFAFAGQGPVIFAVFLAIGVGLALPFTLVAAHPALVRWLPRSGPWMLQLRAGLGFALLATVVWLLWIIGRSAGADAMASLLAWLLALGFATWMFAALRGGSRVYLHAGGSLAIALLLATGVGVVKAERAEAPAPPDASGSARPYQAAAVAQERLAGRPVFVYFTADWCLTCKVNERVVLDDAEVREALARAGFSVFEADWTRRDESIRAELARFGRSGVPLYLLYPADADAPPLRLPELLTKGRFLEALRDAAQGGPRVREITVSPAQGSILSAFASNGDL